LECKR